MNQNIISTVTTLNICSKDSNGNLKCYIFDDGKCQEINVSKLLKKSVKVSKNTKKYLKRKENL